MNANKKTIAPGDVFKALDEIEFGFLKEPLEAEFASTYYPFSLNSEEGKRRSQKTKILMGYSNTARIQRNPNRKAQHIPRKSQKAHDRDNNQKRRRRRCRHGRHVNASRHKHEHFSSGRKLYNDNAAGEKGARGCCEWQGRGDGRGTGCRR